MFWPPPAVLGNGGVLFRARLYGLMFGEDYIARSVHPTGHYSIGTGFMALGMKLPGMWTNWAQQFIGGEHFFIWVMLWNLSRFSFIPLLPMDWELNKRTS
jgi:MFS transporter, PAT family, beta-lactamase induction signal transducer AmpG